MSFYFVIKGFKHEFKMFSKQKTIFPDFFANFAKISQRMSEIQRKPFKWTRKSQNE